MRDKDRATDQGCLEQECRSDEVGVLHRHVEAFLDERVLIVDVGARSDDGLRPRAMVDALRSLGFKSPLTRVEDDSVFDILVAWLVESLWASREAFACDMGPLLIEARSWQL